MYRWWAQQERKIPENNPPPITDGYFMRLLEALVTVIPKRQNIACKN
jgi:hypothetical protein